MNLFFVFQTFRFASTMTRFCDHWRKLVLWYLLFIFLNCQQYPILVDGYQSWIIRSSFSPGKVSETPLLKKFRTPSQFTFKPPLRTSSQDHTHIIQPKKSKNLLKRWITGLSLAGLGTAWIASGNGLFSLGFLITSLLAQNEYYNIVKATGIEPASKTGTISSLMCFLTASMFPSYHELVMPLSSTILMLWLLVFNKKSALISEISTSLLGLLYFGYLPSFWVRLRAIDAETTVRFVVFLNERLPFINLAPDGWTLGAIATWWTWCSIAFADVGAYFIGKSFGRHKLSLISSAAGSASPNKTIEGSIAGFVSCSIFSIMGAYAMRWPLWGFSGLIYGLLIAFLALVGDLTASMMKRDAKVKDSGTLLPGHGGVLDRIDSYLFTAPAAYFFVMNILPLLDRMVKRYARFRS